MELKIFSDSMMDENLYVYYDPASKEGVLIDPGFSGDKALSFIQKEGIKITAILLTHSHADHVATLNQIKRFTNADIMAHKDEEALLKNKHLNFSTMLPDGPMEIKPERYFEDGDVLRAGTASLKVIHTPGHTPGGACFYDEEAGMLFTGDTLFYMSIGRSDFELGDGRALINSIKTKLMTLPERVKVYPGHGQASAISFEKQNNPFF